MPRASISLQDRLGGLVVEVERLHQLVDLSQLQAAVFLPVRKHDLDLRLDRGLFHS